MEHLDYNIELTHSYRVQEMLIAMKNHDKRHLENRLLEN